MEPIYWYGLAYIVGTLFGLWIGHKQGIRVGIVATLDSLVDGNFVRYRTLSDGEIDLIPLSKEEIHGTSKSETS